jgi:hypothetical protein
MRPAKSPSIGVARANLLVAIIVFSRDAAIVVVADQYLPLLPPTRDPVNNDLASAFEPNSRAGTAQTHRLRHRPGWSRPPRCPKRTERRHRSMPISTPFPTRSSIRKIFPDTEVG